MRWHLAQKRNIQLVHQLSAQLLDGVLCIVQSPVPARSKKRQRILLRTKRAAAIAARKSTGATLTKTHSNPW